MKGVCEVDRTSRMTAGQFGLKVMMNENPFTIIRFVKSIFDEQKLLILNKCSRNTTSIHYSQSSFSAHLLTLRLMWLERKCLYQMSRSPSNGCWHVPVWADNQRTEFTQFVMNYEFRPGDKHDLINWTLRNPSEVLSAKSTVFPRWDYLSAVEEHGCVCMSVLYLADL